MEPMTNQLAKVIRLVAEAQDLIMGKSSLTEETLPVFKKLLSDAERHLDVARTKSTIEVSGAGTACKQP